MRSLFLALSLAILGVAPAAAQVVVPAADDGLPDDFHGKVQYFGNHSGEVRATVPGTPRRTDTKCPKREGGCPELIGGSFQAELEFDGDIVRGQYRGTGGMRPSTLIGRRSGANCRLFDTTDGSVWSGRCDREAFIGSVRSVPNAPEQIELVFETVGVNTVDFYQRERDLELVRAYDRLGGIVFGDGAGEARLDAILELQSYFADDGRTGIRATPGAGADVQLYILGSSLFGAQVAAMLGLPYAFASHFAPQALDDALKIYRDRFEPSAVLSEPYAICGYNVFAADTEEEAQLLASSMQQSFVRLRTGQPGKLPPPVEGYRESLPPQLSGMLDGVLSATAIGTRDQVREQMNAFVERTQADELIIAGSIYDHEARKRSLALAAEAFAGEPAAA